MRKIKEKIPTNENPILNQVRKIREEIGQEYLNNRKQLSIDAQKIAKKFGLVYAPLPKPNEFLLKLGSVKSKFAFLILANPN